MKMLVKLFAAIIIVITINVCGCSGDVPKDDGNGNELSADKTEHERDNGEKSAGEESGAELALDETYNEMRNGAHLILTYDSEKNAFVGAVHNMGTETLRRVRVEVHLSNGIELGPTSSVDIKPGEKKDVMLGSTEEPFERWSAHAEVGGSEYGEMERGEHDGGEDEGEHDSKEKGEHN